MESGVICRFYGHALSWSNTVKPCHEIDIGRSSAKTIRELQNLIGKKGVDEFSDQNYDSSEIWSLVVVHGGRAERLINLLNYYLNDHYVGLCKALGSICENAIPKTHVDALPKFNTLILIIQTLFFLHSPGKKNHHIPPSTAPFPHRYLYLIHSLQLIIHALFRNLVPRTYTPSNQISLPKKKRTKEICLHHYGPPAPDRFLKLKLHCLPSASGFNEVEVDLVSATPISISIVPELSFRFVVVGALRLPHDFLTLLLREAILGASVAGAWVMAALVAVAAFVLSSGPVYKTGPEAEYRWPVAG